MVNWRTADTDDESDSDGEEGHSPPAQSANQGPNHLWLFADTPPSLNHSPSALLGVVPQQWNTPTGGNRAPRSLGAALNSTVASEDDAVLNQLQGIMHDDELLLQPNTDGELVSVDPSGFEVEPDENNSEDEDDDDTEDPHDGDRSESTSLQVAAAASSSAVSVLDSSASKVPRISTKLALQRSSHLTNLQGTALSGKACRCKLASALGHDSCLDVFSKAQLSELYCEAHGPLHKPRSKAQVLQELHKMIWVLKVPLPDGPDAHRRINKVPAWKLLDRTVCQAAWMSAYNYTANGVRVHLALVLRGIGPAAEEGRRLAALTMLRLKRVKAGKKDWATQWWFVHLQLHDFLPNECAIQIRGAPWQLVYAKQFIPMATLVSMTCAKSTWMEARPAALRLLAKKYYPLQPETELKLRRSANHSRFAECTACSTLKKTCATSPNPIPPTCTTTRSLTLILAGTSHWQRTQTPRRRPWIAPTKMCWSTTLHGATTVPMPSS